MRVPFIVGLCPGPSEPASAESEEGAVAAHRHKATFQLRQARSRVCKHEDFQGDELVLGLRLPTLLCGAREAQGLTPWPFEKKNMMWPIRKREKTSIH